MRIGTRHAERKPPIIEKLLKQDSYRHINALRVDFDGQKQVVKTFNADRQSTLIMFKGGREMGRSLGDTSKQGI
ncbi:thioredoxin family protein [Candidatus Methylospira mobilis]|uniref:thioredoxin family protein n=1 Tax=Candidatus Methylospira mobilis TaxID=1808979 RepID=UPI001D173037|nr:thioredoxin family protein [Candidatus Methylospira mobilis]